MKAVARVSAGCWVLSVCNEQRWGSLSLSLVHQDGIAERDMASFIYKSKAKTGGGKKHEVGVLFHFRRSPKVSALAVLFRLQVQEGGLLGL